MCEAELSCFNELIRLNKFFYSAAETMKSEQIVNDSETLISSDLIDLLSVILNVKSIDITELNKNEFTESKLS